MSIQNLIDQVNDQTFIHVEDNMKQVQAEQLGLDPRAGYRLYIDDECIAVSMDNDRSLQYYGGFEYVDKEYRTEMGGYVFYNREDNRVQEHMERYEESQVETE
jgi:hypothetical protein